MSNRRCELIFGWFHFSVPDSLHVGLINHVSCTDFALLDSFDVTLIRCQLGDC